LGATCNGFVLAGLLLATVSCGPTSDGALGEFTATQRRELYDRLCASCHGADGRGDGPVAKDLIVRPANLTTLAARRGGTFPREAVVNVLSGQRRVAAHGTREMPVWGQRLAPAESAPAAAAQLEQARLITALTDHVASLQR
jgi:mono/diheme cytochrome c family protein